MYIRGRSVAKASDWIWTESPAEKDAFLPHLVRVCGFIKARACAIRGLQIETEWNLEPRPPDWTDAKTFSSEAVYGEVANFLVTFSVFFGRSEEHQKFVAEVKLNWNSTERSPQNQIEAPDQLHSEALILIWTCNRTQPNIIIINI